MPFGGFEGNLSYGGGGFGFELFLFPPPPPPVGLKESITAREMFTFSRRLEQWVIFVSPTQWGTPFGVLVGRSGTAEAKSSDPDSGRSEDFKESQWTPDTRGRPPLG